MSGIPVDVDEEDTANGAEEPGGRERRRARGSVDVEIEREVTKRHLIEAISSILVVVLYMAFTLLRDKDASVVVLDDDDPGPADDWKEH